MEVESEEQLPRRVTLIRIQVSHLIETEITLMLPYRIALYSKDGGIESTGLLSSMRSDRDPYFYYFVTPLYLYERIWFPTTISMVWCTRWG